MFSLGSKDEEREPGKKELCKSKFDSKENQK